MLLLAHLGSTAALLGVLWTVIAVQKAAAVARTRTALRRSRPAVEAPVRAGQPQPATKDAVRHPGQGVLRPSS